MSSADLARASLAAAAALLAQGRGLDRLSRLLTVTALAALVAVAVLGAPKLMVVALLALSVLAGVNELYFAVRVGFDAALFRRLADAAETSELTSLDQALIAIGLLPADKAGRPLEQRIAGACRLFYKQPVDDIRG
jgi:hypothetical protein